MGKFDNIMEEYRLDILEEQPPQQPPPQDPSMGAGAPPPPDGGAGAPPQEPEGPDPEEVVNELEKESKKPWVDIAGTLGRAMEHKWSDQDIQQINNSLPGGLTIRDFVNVRTSPQIRDKYDSKIVSAAITLFDIVDKMMSENDMGEVVPAEDR